MKGVYNYDFEITKLDHKNDKTFVFIRYPHRKKLNSGKIFVLEKVSKGYIIDEGEKDIDFKDCDKLIKEFPPTGKGFYEACTIINQPKN